MLIQGSLFKDLYIPDSALADIKQQLWLIPEVVSSEIDPDCDELDDDFLIIVYVIQSIQSSRFNDVYRKVKQIAEKANINLGTKIYLLVDVSNEQTYNMLWYRRL